MDPGPQRNEDFLKHVFGLAAIAEDSQDQVVQLPAVAIVELANRELIAGADALDQDDVDLSLVATGPTSIAFTKTRILAATFLPFKHGVQFMRGLRVRPPDGSRPEVTGITAAG